MSKSRGFGGRYILAVLLIVFSLVLPAQGEGAVKYVVPEGSGDGSSWAKAMGEETFRTAIKSAAPGTEFWLAAGVYTPETDESFEPAIGVSIYGGFKGDESSPDERTPGANATALRGSGASVLRFEYFPDGNAPNALDRVVVADNGEDYDFVLDALTITLGQDIWPFDEEYGGGVTCLEGMKLLARDCIFIRNESIYGAAVCLYEEAIFVAERCNFRNNTAKMSGGAVFAQKGATFSAKDCTFKSNKASSLWGGGAVFMHNNTTCTAEDCTFEGNTGEVYGGAVFIYEGSAFTAVNCTFAGNTCGVGGGAVYIYNESAFTGVNCTFTENGASEGGALYSESDVGITNCTFMENSVDDEVDGQSIHVRTGLVAVINSIFWGGGQAGHITIENPQDPPVIRYCIIQGGYDDDDEENHIIDEDPKLGELADNIGPTKTMALLAGSPAIDAGTSEDAPATDQRGVKRPQGSGIDIGAYEFMHFPGGGGGGGCSVGVGGASTLLLLLPFAVLLFKQR